METKETAMNIIELAMILKKLIRTVQANINNRSFSESQYRTLAKLEKMGRSPLKRLSDSMAVSTSSLCIMMNKLHEENLVRRETDSEDRRNTLYELTEEGRKLLTSEREIMIKELTRLISSLEEDKKRSLVYNLKELKEILGDLEKNYND
ncbi:MarR family winged helix-turn-helix transcriptional regulator [Clostridium polynesiense]|uniref:MarR family winged helix-turn-helix transcriptional regulator n=1 Tax=Clostridium polynesiense TaxID=1325933 RepID=UPI000694A51A|nr:MarR family transcriptional regulator [Clostridium polynesiense]